MEAFGQLFVTYPTASGYGVRAFGAGGSPDALTLTGFVEETAAPDSFPLLVRATDPETLYLVLWNSVSRKVSTRQVMVPAAGNIRLGAESQVSSSRSSTSSALRSSNAVGGTWNSKTRELTLVITGRSGAFPQAMWLTHLTSTMTGWVVRAAEEVGGGLVQTNDRPTVLFDARPAAGPHGQYYVYSLGLHYDDDLAVPEVHQQIYAGDESQWINRIMINEWTLTRNAPSATFFGDDIAWGWRLGETDAANPNRLLVFLKVSGTTGTDLTDFDDVGWISSSGLALSLSSVRP